MLHQTAPALGATPQPAAQHNSAEQPQGEAAPTQPLEGA
jgi:hypothetical protein